MTMAAPKIVFTVYGMVNPIRFRPRIRLAPAIVTTTMTIVKIPRMVPAKKTGLPFVFPNIFASALMLFV